MCQLDQENQDTIQEPPPPASRSPYKIPIFDSNRLHEEKKSVNSKMSSEVEETLKRLVAHKGVIGTIVVNNDGIPIKSTLDNHTTTQYAGLINQLVDQVRVGFTMNEIVNKTFHYLVLIFL